MRPLIDHSPRLLSLLAVMSFTVTTSLAADSFDVQATGSSIIVNEELVIDHGGSKPVVLMRGYDLSEVVTVLMRAAGPNAITEQAPRQTIEAADLLVDSIPLLVFVANDWSWSEPIDSLESLSDTTARSVFVQPAMEVLTLVVDPGMHMLVQIITASPNADVRNHLAQALKRIDFAAIGDVYEKKSKERASVAVARELVVKALERWQASYSSAAIKELEPYLSGKVSPLYATQQIWQLATADPDTVPTIMPLLLTMLRDSVKGFDSNLEKSDDPSMQRRASALQYDFQRTLEVLEAAGAQSEEALVVIRDFMKHPDKRVRQRATQAERRISKALQRSVRSKSKGG